MKEEDWIKIGEIVAKAIHNPELKKELLHHTKKTLEKEGLQLEQSIDYKAVENTHTTYNLVIPEKPLDLRQQVQSISSSSSIAEIARFIITKWHENGKEKQEIKENLMRFLASFGIEKLQHIQIKIYENTKSTCYFVIPKKADHNLDELELRQVAGGKST